MNYKLYYIIFLKSWLIDWILPPRLKHLQTIYVKKIYKVIQKYDVMQKNNKHGIIKRVTFLKKLWKINTWAN